MCAFRYCVATSVRYHTANKDPFSLSPCPPLLVQFNNWPNLLTNYANEFVVGGTPCWLSKDLDSLGKGQNVSLAHVWQRERWSRKKGKTKEAREQPWRGEKPKLHNTYIYVVIRHVSTSKGMASVSGMQREHSFCTNLQKGQDITAHQADLLKSFSGAPRR